MASSSATPWPKAAFEHHTGSCKGNPNYPHSSFRDPHTGVIGVAQCPCCTVPPTCPVCLNAHGALLAACRGTTAEAQLAASPGLGSLSGEVLTPDGPVLIGERAFQRICAQMGTTPTELGPIPKAAPSLKKVPTGERMLPTAKAMPQPELPQHPPPPARAARNLAENLSSPEPETESSPRKAPRLSQHEPPAGPDEHGRLEEGAASLPSSPELIPATPPSVELQGGHVELQGGHVELLEQTVSPAQGVSASPLRDAQGQFAWQRRSQSRDSLESELERILEDTCLLYTSPSPRDS